MKDMLYNAIRANNHNVRNALQEMKDKGVRIEYHAMDTNATSGIISVNRVRLYFYVIAPWAMCPHGLIEVEHAPRH